MQGFQFTTYQDMERYTGSVENFVREAIESHIASDAYKVAVEADLYDAKQNVTINKYVQTIYSLSGGQLENFVASNNKIASGFFNTLNTQRCSYSLGNGVSFASSDKDGDGTKEKLGAEFDQQLYDWAYHALEHGVSFAMFNMDRVHIFPLTEFVPLWDEETGALRAGIRFWRLSSDRPLQAVLYEKDGYTRFATSDSDNSTLRMTEEKKAYKQMLAQAPADEYPEVVGEENYGALPIIPMWANRHKVSTLVELKPSIDAYDIIKSGFANDVTDCAEIYWLVENYGGMSDKELARFLDRMRINHVASADTSQGGKVTPYTQEIPTEARETILTRLRSGMYEDFGVLDVAYISAGAKTATEINAAYQPVDNKANEFERYVAEAIKALLALLDIEDEPVFTRDKVVNQLEQVQLVMMEAQYLDEETVLRQLPNISPEEVEGILSRRDGMEYQRFMQVQEPEEE